MHPGERLREIRDSLGITTREVEDYSRRIAEAEGNEEFVISNAWLTQVENQHSTPSIYKLFSLSTIYRIKFTDLLLLFGVDLEKISRHELNAPLAKTHLTSLEVYDKGRAVTFPVRFDPGFRPDKTNLLSRIVEIWGEIPIALVQHLNLREARYAYIGLEDYTLHPLLRPGSFVQIDDRENKIRKLPWRTEYDRPIYFIELRDSYACAWCELQGSTLTLIPHPLSPCSIRQFDYPEEADIIGRVTAVAMRIVDYPRRAPDQTPRLPKPQ